MISTRPTKKLGIDHPVIQAPMAFAAGGKLASAVSSAGGLGLIGGAYGDIDWLSEQFEVADNPKIGCGFITWALHKQPHLLDHVLARRPAALFLSFGNPAPFMDEIKAASVAVICQIQTLRDAKHAIDLGADVIVAQGTEAGGHGDKRATFTLTDLWHNNIEGLKAQVDEELVRSYEALVAGDAATANAFVGEVTVLITEIKSGGELLNNMVGHAKVALRKPAGAGMTFGLIGALLNITQQALAFQTTRRQSNPGPFYRWQQTPSQ